MTRFVIQCNSPSKSLMSTSTLSPTVNGFVASKSGWFDYYSLHVSGEINKINLDLSDWWIFGISLPIVMDCHEIDKILVKFLLKIPCQHFTHCTNCNIFFMNQDFESWLIKSKWSFKHLKPALTFFAELWKYYLKKSINQTNPGSDIFSDFRITRNYK